MAETFDLSLEQAHAYEDLFVPALFAQWVPTLLRHAALSRGQHVLDVACGTGVVARAAAGLVGPSGRVAGVDLNPAMIQVASEHAEDVDWRVADAAALPFDDQTFDAVMCQSALFFFPEPSTALMEVARVLKSSGAVALQTYAGLEHQPGYGPFVDVVVRHASENARELLGTYWSMGDIAELRSLLTSVGIEPTTDERVLGHVTFPSVDALVHTEIQATPLADRITEHNYVALIHDARNALAPYLEPGGALRLPIRAQFVSGRKRPR